ncbi:dethiobiotin synthase [Parafilimonas sp.]|uniref:dethiobiotin synthase n=1 Tax=Parafilimonas sp. TaxID=1969739 RepID=UPI0039E51388
MGQTIFITGIGTDVGKTVAAAVLAEALQADYWKPVQAGFDAGTDAAFIQSVISNTQTKIYPETYKLKLPASPHIAAKEEGIRIELDEIEKDYFKIINARGSSHHSTVTAQHLIIEGAGGIMVPLNENEFVLHLIKKLQAKVVLVSRNYLGSINHSLLTAQVCKAHHIEVLGWIFNDQYMNYEEEIMQWSGYKRIASLPLAGVVNAAFIRQQAAQLKENLPVC